MDDNQLKVLEKFGLLLKPFVERRRDIVIKGLLKTNDKARFIRIVKRLCKLPCLQNVSHINVHDFYCLLKLLKSDFNSVRLKMVISAYSIYIDKKYLTTSNS
jgi:hypothetical protein